MKEMFEKMLFAGVGLGWIAKEKAQDIAQKMTHEAKLSEREGKKLVDDFIKKNEEMKLSIEKRINEIVKKAFKTLNLTDKEEFRKLEDRVKKLESEVYIKKQNPSDINE